MHWPKYPFRAAVLTLAVFLICHPALGETPNPFGTADAPPLKEDPGFFPEEDFKEPQEDGKKDGFTPPPGSPDTFGAADGPGKVETKPLTAPKPPPKFAQPPPILPRGTTPAPGSKSKTAAAPSKLADYLQLDSSVKGLEVKHFDIPDKEIRDVVTLISRWTGKNFILDSKVRGKITILGPSQVSLEEAYHAFLSALEANGLTTVKSGKFIRIIESAEARRAPVETYAGEYAPDNDQFITRIFQLKYINADEVQREFRDLTTRQGKLFAYEPTNSIIITDTGSNIKRIQGILETLDVKGFETTLNVLRIKNTSAKAIAEMLAEIYGDDRQGGSGANRTRTFRRSALERTRGGGIISKIIPDEQTNSLLVLANRSGFDQLTQLVRKLDVKVSDTGRIHVYYCEYAKSEDLAATLSALTGSGSGAAAKSSKGKTPATGAPNLGGQSAAAGANAGGRTGPVTAELEGGIRITSDAATNALVVTANSGDYQTLKRVIKKLDIPRLQVFVETAILEVNLSKDDVFGSNLALSAPGRPFAGGFIGDATSLQKMIQGGLPNPGLSLPLVAGSAIPQTLNIGSNQTTAIQTFPFMGMLTMLTTRSNTTVLSTPQIIALDNEKAEFKVLDETPVQSTFVASVTGGSAGSIGQAGQGTIENKKTGIEITLTPHINAASRSIRLEIEQKINNIRSTGVPTALQAVQIATTTRETNTSVVVKDTDFVMLGGLMSDKIDETVKKVPLLGDIPILGWLFKAKTYSNVKSNLIILLRPKIIGTSTVAANIIDESLHKHDQFVEDNLGGADPHSKGLEKYREKVESQKKDPIIDPFERYRNNPKDDDIPSDAQTKDDTDDGKIQSDPRKGEPKKQVKNAVEDQAGKKPQEGTDPNSLPLLPEDHLDKSLPANASPSGE